MIFIKHVRNKVKTYYTAENECYICGDSEKLEVHHLKCLSVEAKKLLRKNYKLLEYPDESNPQFEEIVWGISRDPEIMHPEYFYTLCQKCHKELHGRFGQNYEAWKPVKKYLEVQRGKHEH